MKRVKDVMTQGVQTLAPHDTVEQAARVMESLDVGVLPVCDGARIVGMLTDRDIVVRGVAQGLAATTTPLEDVMSAQVEWVFEDEGLTEVTAQTITVVESGAVADINDIHALVGQPGIEGVITGRALYDGRLDLATASGKSLNS